MADYKKGSYTPPPYVKNVLDSRKLRLTAAPTGGAQRPHELAVSLYNSNPGLVVFTNIENDKHKGVIRAGMDSQAFFLLLERLVIVADGPNGITEVIENKEKVRDESTGKNIMRVSTRTVIGKGADGKVFISVLSADNDRPKIKFAFGQHYYHPLAGKDGHVLTDAAVSVAAARGWAKLMRNLVPAAMVAAYTPPAPFNGGGGSGGNSSGYKKREESNDDSTFEFDDLPM